MRNSVVCIELLTLSSDHRFALLSAMLLSRLGTPSAAFNGPPIELGTRLHYMPICEPRGCHTALLS
jgi:hypothetical protein